MASETKPAGVYRNKRLMHACTTIVGFTVHLQTKDGSVWEGIFNTFSPEFTICLKLAIQIDPKLNPKDCLYAALKAGQQAEKQAFFDLKDIVRITVLDVDLSYAAAELTKLATDSDISGFDANKSNNAENRQLESWQDDGDTTNADSMLSLDEVATNSNKNDSQNSSRGWDAQEMFRYNERVHKVTTTYDEKLSDYTLPLPKHSSKEWRKKSERAAAIAKEIEGNSKSQGRLAKEDDGDCEEEKFSAVVRPTAPPSAAANINRQQQQQQQQQQQLQPPSNTGPASSNMCHNKNFSRPRVFDRERSRIDSLKNFGSKLSLGPVARQPQSQNHNTRNQTDSSGLNNQNQSPAVTHQQTQKLQPSQQQHQQQTQHKQQHPHSHPQAQQKQSQNQSQHQQQQQQNQQQHQQQQQGTPQASNQPSTSTTTSTTTVSNAAHQQQQQSASTPTQQTQTQAQVTVISASPASTAPTSTVNTSTLSERSDTSSLGSQAKDHQSELARKSTLNPNAKEFVYKPRSPAINQAAQTNGSNQISLNVASTIDPNNSSPMSQAPHAGNYYQQVPMFPHGLSPHQQPHHAAQFMPNHPHFQNQIHYMSPVPPHFAQQMSQRYIRSNFQNYHHRGEHHSNVRADYSQASMMAPTSTGQPFVASPSGAPHPMNAYAASPQQPMIYSGPPQSMYPVVQAGFPQHMPHVMPNPPPPYDGSAVYMPSQNYIVNP